MVEQDKFCSVSSINHGMSILLPVVISNLSTHFVIYTGACLSILSNGLFYRIPPERRPELRPVSRLFKLEVADDSLLHVEGVTTLEFRIKNEVFSWDFCVAPIREDGLIGLDFLQANDYVMGAKSGLRLNNRKYETVVEKVPLRAVRVICKENVTVPANSEFILEGGANSLSLCSAFALISPCQDTDLEGLIIGNTLVKSSKNGANLPVRVANISCENLVIKRGTTLGYMQSVEECDIMQDSSVDEKHSNLPYISRVSKGNSVLPLPGPSLYKNSSTDLVKI